MEIASKFRAQGTPMGYRIDKAGRIASELTVGAEPLLKLAATIVADQDEAGVPGNGSASSGGKGDPSLARSRLNRNGLKAGAPAPVFRLPRVDGGELSLADLRGGRVLLVFSDPDCGPCDELAPRLQEIHLRRADLQVLVVSRRDVEANRAKAAALGLTFPHRAAAAVGNLSPVRDVRHPRRLSDRRAGNPRQRCRRGSRAHSGPG